MEAFSRPAGFPRRELLALMLLAACGGTGKGAGAPADSTTSIAVDTAALRRDEQGKATGLLVEGRAAMASLYRDSSHVKFTDLRVVQPPPADGRTPPITVCGTVDGRAANGRPAGPHRFIYQSRVTVFLEEDANREMFGKIWDATCGSANARAIPTS